MINKMKVVCDGSYSHSCEYASIACTFKYKDEIYNYSKKIDVEHYKENLERMGSNFVEMYAILFSMEKLAETHLVKHPIQVVNDNKYIVDVINKSIKRHEMGRNIYYKNKDITSFLLKIINLYQKFDDLEFGFLRRKYTKEAHNLCKKEVMSFIKKGRSKLILVERINENRYIAKNKKKGTSYIVNIEEPYCSCKYFYCANKGQDKIDLCKHIIAVSEYIKANEVEQNGIIGQAYD